MGMLEEELFDTPKKQEPEVETTEPATPEVVEDKPEENA